MSTYKPDLMDISEAQDELEWCLAEAARLERKGNPDANRVFQLALDAEQSYRRIKNEYLCSLQNDDYDDEVTPEQRARIDKEFAPLLMDTWTPISKKGS